MVIIGQGLGDIGPQITQICADGFLWNVSAAEPKK
jgi:hypothetical protein